MASDIERTCYWLARRPVHEIVPLEGRHEAEIAIVGAGLTGLWTALFLKELAPTLALAVLERGGGAWRASGRNAGILSETIDHSHGLAIQHFGEPEARRLARLGEQNVSELGRFLVEREIDCDYEATGRLIVALTEAQLDETRRTVETAHRLGLDSFRLLDVDEVQAELHSRLYRGGVSVSGGAILDPVKLLDGLRREVERLGVQVFERSPVNGIHGAGATVRLDTPAGSLTARRAILATSAYTHLLLPAVLSHFIPLYDYVLVSDPLTPDQRAAIGWRHRQSVTDGRSFFNYYRLTRDDRILWGTSEAAYYRGNRVDDACDHSPAHYISLRDSFRRHFPPLERLEFPYAWGGAICSTTRLTPFFGTALGGRVLYGLGYTGHGLGTTRIAGRILAHMAVRSRSELLDLALVKSKPFPYPPEPIRGWVVAAVTRALRRVDEGAAPGWLLRILDRLGLGFSS